MWLPRWLGELYSSLYSEKYDEVFTFNDVQTLVKSDTIAKVALSRLRKNGVLYVHGYANKHRLYRLCDPDVMVLLASKRISNLQKIKQGVYARLLGCITAELLKKVEKLRSVVLYGSASRGCARADSDIDLLVVSETNAPLGERIDSLLKIEYVERIKSELNWLYRHGIDTHITFLPLNSKEAEAFPPILLDVIEDGILLVDDGFFKNLIDKMKLKLDKLGAKRVFISPDEWYWDLKPDLKYGEVVSI